MSNCILTIMYDKHSKKTYDDSFTIADVILISARVGREASTSSTSRGKKRAKDELGGVSKLAGGSSLSAGPPSSTPPRLS